MTQSIAVQVSDGAIALDVRAPLDTSRVTDVFVEGIDMKDYPDFCDAYISEAKVDGRPATDEELEELNDNREYVYEKTIAQIY